MDNEFESSSRASKDTKSLQKKIQMAHLKPITCATRNLFSETYKNECNCRHHTAVEHRERIKHMNNFLKGILVGVGVGLLVAPMKGDEMRKIVSERIGELRGYIPENEQLDVYKSQISDRVNHTAGTLKDYAQQAATTVKSSANTLSHTAQDAGSTVKDSAQDITDTTKRTINSNNPNR
jgi:gas vesicle protein